MQKLIINSLVELELAIQKEFGDDPSVKLSGISRNAIALIPCIPCFMIFHDPKRGWICGSYTDSYNDDECDYWDSITGAIDGYMSNMVIAPTFEIAVCLAALKTKGIDAVPVQDWDKLPC